MSISLDRLSKRFGNLPVVDQVSLDIAEGELFVLLGSSGSGKSTILRLIAGLARADGGRILIHGRDVGGLPPQERGTGFVFQNYAIFRHMTVARNVEFGLRIRNVPAAERAKKREELLDLVGLVGLGNRYAHELSGGQLQRVALARALAYSPGVLLLDEPFGALDAKIRGQLRRHLREIQKQLSVTTLLVTHDQDEAFDLGDRIGVLERGHLLEAGRPEELYVRPKTLFVATFLGAGTVLAGRAEGNRANLGDFTLPIPPEIPHETGSRVRALFRPENVSLASDPSRVEGTLIGEARVVEESFAGSSRRIRLRLPRRPAVRQVAPPVPFGEEGLLLDALVPANFADRGPALWVGLRSWQILQRPSPRVLIVTAPSDPLESLAAAAGLTSTIGGVATVLRVTEEPENVDAVRDSLKSRTDTAGLSGAELKVRAGRLAEQIIAEQVESLYDLLVLDPFPEGRKHPVRSRAAMSRLLEASATPVLVLAGPWRPPAGVLACTAVGEPGKTVVRVAGWLARGLGSPVTLLHVAREAVEPGDFVRAHLARGVAALRSFEVAAETRIRTSRVPAEGILAEAREGEAGLIAIGGHGPRARSIFGRDDVTMQILTNARMPVLVVPENAW